MSRINRRPILIPQGVSCQLDHQVITVTGGKQSLSMTLPRGFSLDMTPSAMSVKATIEGRRVSEMLGSLCRLIGNMVKGVSVGFEKRIELIGVGYKAALQGSDLKLSLGYSHEIIYKIPQNISVVMEKPTHFKIMGADKQEVGQVASEISNFRPPEPYKGKGVHIAGQYVHRKSGKSK